MDRIQVLSLLQVAPLQHRENTFCSYLHQTENIKYVVERQDAVIDGHQTAQPGGGGYQQQQEGISNSATAERERRVN